MKKQGPIGIDTSTEQRILEAARKVFMQKGYAASRTRDIAEEAGINLALLNYYFRSKEKLFDIVMMENLNHLMSGFKLIINDASTSLHEKVVRIATGYIELLKENPDLPVFVLSEIRVDPRKFAERIEITDTLKNSHLFAQLKGVTPPGKNPWHLIINTLALCIFPFVGRPLLQLVGEMSAGDFQDMMEERKQLIPEWIREMYTE